MMSRDDTMLKKPVHGLFQHAKQKARFLLCFIFQISEKWQYILYRIAVCNSADRSTSRRIGFLVNDAGLRV
jgi:hypothetical protein